MVEKSKSYIIDYFIQIISYMVIAITLVMVAVAVFDANTAGEASVGTFEVYDFNDNWKIITDDDKIISLPYTFENDEKKTVTITNTLPDSIANGMSVMARASLADMNIYIDGELRESYLADNLEAVTYYPPSAYVVVRLGSQDAGKEIKIETVCKTYGRINEVSISQGNDVWYPVLRDGMAVNLAAIIVLFLGIVLSIVATALHSVFGGNASPKYLGLLMIDVGLWVISESTMRQFIFQRPSLTQIFSYFTVELMGALACIYFDEVQHRKHHKLYMVIESVILLQLLTNLVLDVTRVVYLHDSLIASHVWTAVAIVIVIITIVKDILDHDINSYKITAIGMAGFIAMALVELVGYYVTRFKVLGPFVCGGLVILMTFTIVQMLYDVLNSSAERERAQMQVINNTIETIASSIDAKDEYTGGHSERVGKYAERLAREVAADYGFSEDDILRIRYIGLVHDIGKIGVADTVLNKAGRLTDEEFSLMKKHTEIGYEIMGATGESMDGLLDGIRYHHERFDGRGYPTGLAYTDIPLIARILSLADSYDAMTSNRVYRKRLSDEDVKNEFIKCSGTQFDPALTTAFVRLIERGELKVSTEDGMATDETGATLISSILENRLHTDLLQKLSITNPSHVRMMCYVIKLMEKKGKSIAVIFYGPDNAKGSTETDIQEVWEELDKIAKKKLTSQDMIIKYNEDLNVLSVFERSQEEVKALVEELKAKGVAECISKYSQSTE